MNIEEKRRKLEDYCLKHTCSGIADLKSCALKGDLKCTIGITNEHPEKIDAMYEFLFGNDTEQTDTPHIKDSGERREFPSGSVRDMSAGKGRMDLLPWAAILEVSKHCENGAEKYGEHNVDKGLPTHSFCDSAARHLAKYLDGWDDEPHLLAAAWNLLWAIQMEVKHPEEIDTPWEKYKHKYEPRKEQEDG